jgi:hypothetical protein
LPLLLGPAPQPSHFVRALGTPALLRLLVLAHLLGDRCLLPFEVRIHRCLLRARCLERGL